MDKIKKPKLKKAVQKEIKPSTIDTSKLHAIDYSMPYEISPEAYCNNTVFNY